MVEGPERDLVRQHGFEVGCDGTEISLHPVPDRSAFEARLKAIGAERYHDKHPFHRMLQVDNAQ